MPELPEVQTTVNGLKNKALNRAFLDVWTDTEKIIGEPVSSFRKKIKGKKIIDIKRAGKNIVFLLSEDYSLLVHQKLTGHLLYGRWKDSGGNWVFADKKSPIFSDPMNRFIHIVFFLDNGEQIALSDLRKFAKVRLKKTKEIEKELSGIAKDPLSMTFREFKEAINGRKRKIKTILMEQNVISGVGNIYSDEALFRAGVSPLRQADSLTEEEMKKLFVSVKDVLKKGIALGGESISDYRNINGEKGKFDKERMVYRRNGKKCPICGNPIKRVVINGRSAHFCPVCQK